MLAACARDEQAMSDAAKATLEQMLAALAEAGLGARFTRLLLREEETPTLSGFESQMRRDGCARCCPTNCTSGTVSLDGRDARPSCWTRPIDSDEGGDAQIARESVPLDSAGATTGASALATLESLMIRD